MSFRDEIRKWATSAGSDEDTAVYIKGKGWIDLDAMVEMGDEMIQFDTRYGSTQDKEGRLFRLDHAMAASDVVDLDSFLGESGDRMAAFAAILDHGVFNSNRSPTAADYQEAIERCVVSDLGTDSDDIGYNYAEIFGAFDDLPEHLHFYFDADHWAHDQMINESGSLYEFEGAYYWVDFSGA